jgi:hypothetical protein
VGAYFVRRLTGGAVSLVVIMFLAFTFLVEGPLGARNPQANAHGNRGFQARDCSHDPRREILCQEAYIDKPWPLNYLDWWLDPETPDHEFITSTYERTRKEPRDHLYLPAHALAEWRQHTYWAGVLTGYLGQSIYVAGESISSLIGEGWWLVHLFMLKVILALVAVAVRQRWCRPLPVRTHNVSLASLRDKAVWVGKVV